MKTCENNFSSFKEENETFPRLFEQSKKKKLSWLKITSSWNSLFYPHPSFPSACSSCKNGSSCEKRYRRRSRKKVFCLFPFHCFFFFCTDNYPESDNIQRLFSERTSSNAERHQFTSNFTGITFSVTESKCELSNALLSPRLGRH